MSVATGRSRCDGCGRTLATWELVPVVSGLLLRRCSTCATPIARLHTGVEVASGCLCAAAFALAPPVAAAAWSLAGLMLLTLAVFDWRGLWLPDALTLPLAIIGLLAGGLASGVPTLDRVIGGAVGWRRWRRSARAFAGCAEWKAWAAAIQSWRARSAAGSGGRPCRRSGPWRD